MHPPDVTEFNLLMTWTSHFRTFEAWEEVNSIVSEEPEAAWKLIQEMVALAPDDLALAALAAGPLEDLLNDHPKPFVRLAAALARTDGRFHKCLGDVWGLEGQDEKIVSSALAKPAKTTLPVRGAVSRKRAALIGRWFHCAATSWAHEEVRKQIRTNPEAAWRQLIFLTGVATDPPDDLLLDAIHTHVLDPLVTNHPGLIVDRVVSEAETNPTFRGWIERRRSYAQIDPAWQELLRKAGTPAS